jgi:predicted nuclease of predicted toxin-antitoxin system
MKLLIDECLSPELTKLAHTKGYGETSHVVWLGQAGPEGLGAEAHNPRRGLDLCD